MMILAQFTGVWIVIVAVDGVSGQKRAPLALVAADARSDAIIEMDLRRRQGDVCPPYPICAQTLLVTIDGQDLAATHLALNWQRPGRLLDLMVEYRNTLAGRSDMRIGGLAGALLSYARPLSDALATGATPPELRRRLLAVRSLFNAVVANLDVGRALLRGRYLCAVAQIEATGVPVDSVFVERLAKRWLPIRSRTVEIIDEGFRIYRQGRLDKSALAEYLVRHRIPWPKLQSGLLDLTDGAFRDMARAYSLIRPLKEIRTTLRDFDPSALTIGGDGRNRTPLRPFASVTGRNQPSSKASVLGTAAWVRHLILPEPGTGLALLDWSQQEFGIAAALASDAAMQDAYRSGDPYLALAVLAGAAPSNATPATHADVRARYKICALGIQYGMRAATLARLASLSLLEAERLQRRHRIAFPKFWQWSDAVEAQAYLTGHLTTVFGWRIDVRADANPRTLRNFPLQANGAEMLRLACCLAIEDGIRVCTPLHDALLIEAPLEVLDETVRRTQAHMAEASRIVLDGFQLTTEVKVVRAPHRWSDLRGSAVWQAVEQALEEETTATVAGRPPDHQRDSSCSPANPRAISLYVSSKDSSDASD